MITFDSVELEVVFLPKTDITVASCLDDSNEVVCPDDCDVAD